MEFNNQDLEKKIRKAGPIACDLRNLLKEISSDFRQESCDADESDKWDFNHLEDSFQSMADQVAEVEDALFHDNIQDIIDDVYLHF